MTALSQSVAVERTNGWVGGIPVRNLWLLMLYASQIFRQIGRGKVAIEQAPDDIPDLIAEILAHAVERRLKRNLTFGYQVREAELSRVRGHIDVLTTEGRQLLARGLVACRYDDLTVDTPRNRFVRAALETIAGIIHRPELSRRCRVLSFSLRRLGVAGEKPDRSHLSADRFSRHDRDDQFMVAAARLAFDLMLPTESEGNCALPLPDRDIVWIRRLFEKAVAGFYEVVLSAQGWRVTAGKCLEWQIERKTPGVDRILPSMKTDIILDNAASGRRIVIDTKFTSILAPGWHRKESLKSGYIYQLYAYLRSQEEPSDPLSNHAAGLLLHPAVGEMVDERVVIQGHELRFATVDLAATATEIRSRLLQMAARQAPAER